ncbi:MAG: succinate dehydrogenase assembly factor 2 [Gammaproteobacteria bacterium]
MARDPVELRRLRWRCRRGMRELDELLMAFMERTFESSSPAQQQAFEDLLSLQDPEILSLLTERVRSEDPDLHELVQRLLGRSGAEL